MDPKEAGQWVPLEVVAVAAVVVAAVAVVAAVLEVVGAATVEIVVVAVVVVVVVVVAVAVAAPQGSEFCVGAYVLTETVHFWAKFGADNPVSHELTGIVIWLEEQWHTSSPGEVLLRFPTRCCCMDNCCCIGCAPIGPRFCNCPCTLAPAPEGPGTPPLYCGFCLSRIAC